MIDSTRAVAGLDVHKTSVCLAAVSGTRLVHEVTLPHDGDVVERTLHTLGVEACCYEAGPTGFGLARHLRQAGIACEVVAPSLIPVRPGERVKTDRRDARRLAELFQGGLLQPVWVPSTDIEALRDLVRAREDARCDRMRARQRLGSFLLRHARQMPTTTWGVRRREWLGSQSFDALWQQAAFDDYLVALDLADRRIESLGQQMAAAAAEAPYGDLVARLRCLRGVDTLTALGLVAEVGDFARFDTAGALMSYVGLVPSERSSGLVRRQGSITKTGNGHARRLLVEAAWNARRRPRGSYPLERRRQGQDPRAVARARHCEMRLHRRWMRMSGRGKPSPTIAVAVARELCGFVWAIATDQPLREA
ncbi:MAG TPA: IS110 family transposase [Methylomirabilota bacterium]|jgi:transposase